MQALTGKPLGRHAPSTVDLRGALVEHDHVALDDARAEHRLSVAKLWRRIPSLPAVEQGRVYAVADDIFVVPGPRVVEAAQSLFRMIPPYASA